MCCSDGNFFRARYLAAARAASIRRASSSSDVWCFRHSLNSRKRPLQYHATVIVRPLAHSTYAARARARVARVGEHRLADVLLLAVAHALRAGEAVVAAARLRLVL